MSEPKRSSLDQERLENIRSHGETTYRYLLFGVLLALFMAVELFFFRMWTPLMAALPVFLGFWWCTNWVSFRIFYWLTFGDSVRLNAAQYPKLYTVVRQAASELLLQHDPAVFVKHGHGVLHSIAARFFSRRGVLVLTSNLVDDLTATGDTRAIMMIIGRHLGQIAAGHFRYPFIVYTLGRWLYPLYAAYLRRCELTADRIGYLIVGDLNEAERALLTLTVGKRLAPQTKLDEIKVQRDEASDSFLAVLIRWLRVVPYMIDRIEELRLFQVEQNLAVAHGKDMVNVVNIQHCTIETQLIAGTGATVHVAPPLGEMARVAIPLMEDHR